ncbi:ParB/RepB/Spo0J family partition protein [Candidatus Chloroploca sp. Khr17]|uniref:ParB/RepB/Spo0J family partition protein n=1 Tax=Candidatus Chloroploca sp. Khr17 TaxID=2496869 RepID=UPI00101DC740|nr:ParB/RepB/Spo0J family partition protein [Candidatus Chloroploca sp. Khr17]
MSRRRGLGSGLDALMSSGPAPGASNAIRQIPLDAIRSNRSQPRSHFDEQALDELAASIRAHGLIQPVIVTEDDEGGYELIAGERRWRAARRAGLREVPALVKSTTPQELLELAIVENVQRADLNALEEGQAYQTLKDEFGLTDEMIAQRVGKSRVTVVNTRRLIKLATPARQALLDGAISAGHGRALLRLEEPTEQSAVLELIVRRDLSVREAERMAELALHQQVHPATREALLHGTISAAHAQALLRLEDPALQNAALEQVLALGLSTRASDQFAALLSEGVALASAVEQVRGAPPAASLAPRTPATTTEDEPRPPRRTPVDPNDEEARRLFENLLETPVQLVRTGRQIRLTITVYDDEQLQHIYERLNGTE